MGYSAAQVIAIAEAEVGYQEKQTNAELDSKTANAGHGNYTKYARDLHDAGYYNKGNKNGYAWCDVFVDWCHYIAAGKNAEEAQRVICQTGSSGACCSDSREYYRAAGRLFEAPQPGDQIFFSWSGDSTADHTGIVYHVDSNYVYTIEGNTSPDDPLEGEGNGVYHKKRSLNESYIYGYGRPLYDGSSNWSNLIFTPNSEAIKSATEHNFFNIKVKNVQATSVTIELNVDNTEVPYEWSYLLTDLKRNSPGEPQSLWHSDYIKIEVDKLIPYTPYVFKVTAKNNYLQSSKQVFFATTQELPGPVRDLNVSFSSIDLQDTACKVSFKQPKSWGNYEGYCEKGYRVLLLLNGTTVSYSDDLISYSKSNIVDKYISIDSLISSIKDLIIGYDDTLQIGIQSWVKDSDNRILLSSLGPACSQAKYLAFPLSKICNIFTNINDKFMPTNIYQQ